MANPQLEDGYIRIANEIWDQVMMRDFSKRQRAVLDLILRLSWGCQRKIAHIPHQSDFEIVGVGRTHIKRELDWLSKAGVISWDRDKMLFAFNKNYNEWKVSIVRGYDEGKLAKLVAINISGVTKTVTQSYQKSNPELPKQEPDVTETVTEGYQNSNPYDGGVTETVTEGYQNSNRGVTKTVTPIPEKDDNDAGYEPRKDSIKDILKTTTTDKHTYVGESSGLVDDRLRLVTEAYKKHIGMLGGGWYHRLIAWHEENGMDVDTIVAAIEATGEAKSEGRIHKNADSFLDGILRNWYNEGIRTIDDVRARGRPSQEDADEYLDGILTRLREREASTG